MQDNYKKIIQNSIAYLINQQLPDGSFESFSSKEIDNFSDAHIYHTNFITAIILETLSYLQETPELQKIKKKNVEFLLSQKNEDWSWNYWSKNAKESKTMPYPNDLDDTFCALNALYMYDKEILTGSALAKIIKLLTFVEIKEGGPYKTWLVQKKTVRWDDVDIVVNSNIAYFLSMQETILPNLQLFFKKSLQKKDIRSPYYPSMYPFLYFLSRFYPEKKSIEGILLSAQNKNEYWENPLYTALAVLALLNGEFPPQKLRKSIAYLLEAQKNNHWQAYAFCIDPMRNGQRYYAGSSVLTTTFCLAALQRYQHQLNKVQIFEKSGDIKKERYLQKILSGKEFQLPDKDLAKQGKILLEKTLSKDKTQQIPLMPYYFFSSLKSKKHTIKNSDIVLLGRANVLGWLAYTIYDDFLDEEGIPPLLPMANIYLRRLTLIFDHAFARNKFVTTFFHTVLDRIESANSWETTHCRLSVQNGFLNLEGTKLIDYGNLEQLAHKSLGHGLGPLTIFLLLGYKEKSKEFVSLYNFFIHYLIARQLHDDAHDWEHDLSKGHITFTVSLLLKKAKEKKIITTKKMEIKKTISKLHKLFWYEVIEEICVYIHNHVKKAKEELNSSSVISNASVLEKLLQVYEDGANKALEERKKTIDFLQVY